MALFSGSAVACHWRCLGVQEERASASVWSLHRCMRDSELGASVGVRGPGTSPHDAEGQLPALHGVQSHQCPYACAARDQSRGLVTSGETGTGRNAGAACVQGWVGHMVLCWSALWCTCMSQRVPGSKIAGRRLGGDRGGPLPEGVLLEGTSAVWEGGGGCVAVWHVGELCRRMGRCRAPWGVTYVGEGAGVPAGGRGMGGCRGAGGSDVVAGGVAVGAAEGGEGRAP